LVEDLAGDRVVNHSRVPPHLVAVHGYGEVEERAAGPLQCGQVADPSLDAYFSAEPEANAIVGPLPADEGVGEQLRVGRHAFFAGVGRAGHVTDDRWRGVFGGHAICLVSAAAVAVHV
jgi:hypothetical protein